ncbi:hypothetical protein OROHE_004303 [Orobanche hederae]
MKKRVARILFFKIRPSQEILKIRDGTPLETEEILTYIKSPQNRSFWHFYSNLDVPSNVVHKKIVARNLFIKIRPSQEILNIRDGTSLETEEILTYIKNPQNRSVWHFSSNLDVPINVVQKKRVARILFFKIRPSQEILKIRDGTPLEAEEILIYIKKPSNKSVWHFSSNLDVTINVVQKNRVARILFFKIRPSQKILKIRDGTPLEREQNFDIHKKALKQIGLALFYNVVQKKRVARILFFKIRPSQEILKIRHGTPLETEEILTYRKSPQNRSFWHFYSNLDVPSNVVHKKRVARILFIKIRPSQEILKIRDVQKKRVARILFFKIRPSQEILKIRDGTPLEAEEILTYIKSPQNRSFWHFYSNLDVPSNVVHKKRVARNLFIKIRLSQEILKIRDGTSLEMEEILTYIKKPSKQIEILKIRHGTPLETEEILTYIKSPQNRSFWHFYSNLDVPSNVVQKKRVARILFFKIRPSQEILKIRDDVPSNVVHKKRVARNLFIKIRPSQEILKIRDGTSLETEEILMPSQEILKIRDGTHLETEEILIYIKKPSNKSVWHFSSKLDILSNVVHKKRVARILFFKIRPSQEILKIRDVQKKRVARILFFKIRPSQEILKIRDGTPLETEEILTYIKSPQNRSFWHFYSNLDVPSNVVHKKRVARNLFIKIRPSQEILKIRDGTSLETEEILAYIKKPSKQIVARILFFKIRPSQEILKIRDGTHLETEEILIYIKKPSNKSVWHFSSKLDILSNVVHKKRVARILFFKIRPSQEILKIRDGTPMEAEEILIYIKKHS